MSNEVYLGVKGSVVAIDKTTGHEKWRTHLRGSGFVTTLVDTDIILAHTNGHLYGVDKHDGRQLWHNELPGLGYGLGMLAVEGGPGQEVLAQVIQAQRAAAAAGGAGAAGAAGAG